MYVFFFCFFFAFAFALLFARFLLICSIVVIKYLILFTYQLNALLLVFFFIIIFVFVCFVLFLLSFLLFLCCVNILKNSNCTFCIYLFLNCYSIILCYLLLLLFVSLSFAPPLLRLPFRFFIYFFFLAQCLTKYSLANEKISFLYQKEKWNHWEFCFSLSLFSFIIASPFLCPFTLYNPLQHTLVRVQYNYT